MPEHDTPTVIHRTRDQLLAQRERLLNEVHLTHEQLRDRAATYSLTLDELDVWHTVEGIDYLLGAADTTKETT